MSLIVFAKRFIIDIWWCSKYDSNLAAQTPFLAAQTPLAAQTCPFPWSTTIYICIYKSRGFLLFCYKNISRNNGNGSIFVSSGGEEARITFVNLIFR